MRKRRPFCSHAGSCRDLISQSRGALEVALGVPGPMTTMTSQRPGRRSRRSRTRADWSPAVIWPRLRQIQGALPISGSVPRVGQHCSPEPGPVGPRVGASSTESRRLHDSRQLAKSRYRRSRCVQKQSEPGVWSRYYPQLVCLYNGHSCSVQREVNTRNESWDDKTMDTRPAP